MKSLIIFLLAIFTFWSPTRADMIHVSADSLLGPQFRAFVERVETAPPAERSAIIDSFMNAASSFPFIEENTIVYYIYRGSGNTVTTPGDANGWDPNAFPMTRLADTNFWYREAVFEADARLDYKFVINGSNWILDPLNPRQVAGGFGPNSELAMPEYVDPPEILFNPNIPHGVLQDTIFFSTILNNSRRVRVYTPPFYDPAGSDSFPVILFHDGLEYITLASAKNVLDNLIAEGRIQPLIGVFVPPVDRDNEYAFNRTAQFESFIVDELMPAIDERWRTQRRPRRRAMVGISFGGLITTQITYNRAESFGLSAPFSPSYWAKNMEVFHTVVNGPVKDIRFYLDWGTYEPGIMFPARDFRNAVLILGYSTAWNEWHEGHSWGSWRAHLDIALEYFFPGPAVAIEDENEFTFPREFELLQNFPNPFNPETTIRYRLPAAAHVILKIYNPLGQEVQTLVNGMQPPGENSITWNGRDNAGRPAGSGLYFYRLIAGKFTAVRKMVLLR